MRTGIGAVKHVVANALFHSDRTTERTAMSANTRIIVEPIRSSFCCGGRRRVDDLFSICTRLRKTAVSSVYRFTYARTCGRRRVRSCSWVVDPIVRAKNQCLNNESRLAKRGYEPTAKDTASAVNGRACRMARQTGGLKIL